MTDGRTDGRTGLPTDPCDGTAGPGDNEGRRGQVTAGLGGHPGGDGDGEGHSIGACSGATKLRKEGQQKARAAQKRKRKQGEAGKKRQPRARRRRRARTKPPPRHGRTTRLCAGPARERGGGERRAWPHSAQSCSCSPVQKGTVARGGQGRLQGQGDSHGARGQPHELPGTGYEARLGTAEMFCRTGMGWGCGIRALQSPRPLL